MLSKLSYIFISLFLSFELRALAPEIINGDKLYEKRENIKLANEALSLFEKAISKNPNDSEALWRASMASYYVGHLKKDRLQRKKFHRSGVKYGEDCVKITKGKDVSCHFWLATNLALLKKERGLLSLAFGISDLIELFELTLKLDPHYAGAGPLRMLALLHFEAPGFLGGDTKKSYSYIKRAIKLSSNEPLNYYFYIKFLNKDGQTNRALEIAKEFSSKANPQKFTFFESKNAFNKILHFIKTKELLSID